MSSLRIDLKKFTWDYPNETFSEEEFLHSHEFVSRILKYGDIKNWVWVINKLGRKKMINFIILNILIRPIMGERGVLIILCMLTALTTKEISQ